MAEKVLTCFHCGNKKSMKKVATHGLIVMKYGIIVTTLSVLLLNILMEERGFYIYGQYFRK